MLHLAQVQAQDSADQTKLQLLAVQKSEPVWELVVLEASVLVARLDYAVGVLLLVDLSPTGEVIRAENAKAWVLELVKQYVAMGMSPQELQQEEQRAEQWRQSLTLQSQELGRRSLEMEARRDQIQDLEEKVKLDRQQLEQKGAELQQQAIDLEARHAQLLEMQSAIDTEKQQLQQRLAELEAQLKSG